MLAHPTGVIVLHYLNVPNQHFVRLKLTQWYADYISVKVHSKRKQQDTKWLRPLSPVQMCRPPLAPLPAVWRGGEYEAPALCSESPSGKMRPSTQA